MSNHYEELLELVNENTIEIIIETIKNYLSQNE